MLERTADDYVWYHMTKEGPVMGANGKAQAH
jgi:hypothetical protein